MRAKCLPVLAWVLVLVLVRSVGSTKEEETAGGFPHLWRQIEDTKRIHIISEAVRDGQRVQIEEFLDFTDLNQLVQLKWQGSKLNALILNQRNLLYRYRPYECASIKLDGQNHFDGDSDWTQFITSREANATGQNERLAKSFISTAPNSPFLKQSKGKAHRDDQKSSKWIMGLLALWLNAQDASKAPYPLHDLQADKEVIKKGVWRLNFDEQYSVDFYFQPRQDLERGSSIRGVESQFEVPSFIEVKRQDKAEIVMSINIFHFEFNYSDRLSRNLFTLPIGLDCPENYLFSSSSVYFWHKTSQLMEFEIVASRLASVESSQPAIDVKNIQLANVPHPLNQSLVSTMFYSHEDRFKLVQDDYYKLEYRIHFNGLAPQCTVSHLLMSNGSEASLNPNRVLFSNGIQLQMDSFHMNYVMGFDEADTKQMRLLNVLEIAQDKNELVFEANVPEPYRQLVSMRDSLGYPAELNLKIVRVYEQQVVRSNFDKRTKIRLGLVDLTRVLLLVFNHNSTKKLAEIRFNLFEDIQLINYMKRAQLFDLSLCYDLERDSMELVVYYPADPKLLDSIGEQANEILNSFYMSSLGWLPLADSNLEAYHDLQSQKMDKRRLQVNLNYLRVPKAELRVSQVGDLELHVTILERISPLHMYEKVSGATFETKGNYQEDHQVILVESLEECARECQLFECKVFAFNEGRQCKMSHLPVAAPEHWQSGPGGNSVPNNTKQRYAKLVVSSAGSVYYEPAFLTAKPLQEATLAELNSYIEHASGELQADGGAEELRQRRDAASRQPLFAFDFLDRSSMANEYDLPKTRMLMPSEFILTRLPLVFDVRARSQATRINQAFRVRHTGKGYQPTALDGPDEDPQMFHPNSTAAGDITERVFIDNQSKVYYTLKKVTAISQDNCALLCYNIDEWNSRSHSEQVCESFSYSSFMMEDCYLLIRTDFKFVGSLLEVAQEGDIVHEIHSVEQLLGNSFQSIVADRNYLPQFEGPIRLASPDFVADKSTASDQCQRHTESLKLKWLLESVIEVDQVEDDKREACAQVCTDRNRNGRMCLAFDYCLTNNQTNGSVRQELACYLLLVMNDNQQLQSRAMVRQVSWLRWHLTQATGKWSSSEVVDEVGPHPQVAQASEAACSRYVMSHSRDYNYLSRRKVNLGELEGKLEELLSMSEVGTNVEHCAMECSLQYQDCLLFEFCQSVPRGPHPVIERNCTLYRRSPNLAVGEGKVHRFGGLEKGLENEKPIKKASILTNYHQNCHIYLRREFESIEATLSEETQATVTRSDNSAPEFTHGFLTVCFIVTYAALLLLLVAYVTQARRRPTARAQAAIMMDDINLQLARSV